MTYANITIPFYGKTSQYHFKTCLSFNSILWHIQISQVNFMAYANLLIVFPGIFKSLNSILRYPHVSQANKLCKELCKRKGLGAPSTPTINTRLQYL